MIYEMRTYTLKPGTVSEFESRFAERHPYREAFQAGRILAHRIRPSKPGHSRLDL